MIDSLVSLVLVGLGILNPVNNNVKGVTATPTPTVAEVNDSANVTPTKKDSLEVKNRLKLEEQAKNASKEAVFKNKEKVREELKNRRESFVEEMKTKRLEAIEKFKADREKFKERLTNIKDEKKKEIVSRMDERVSEMNTNRTELISEHVKKLEEIVEKLSAAITQAQSQGKNTSIATSKLATTQTAITAAKTAITTQATKEYVISITTEAKLRADVGRTLSQLESDLKATQKTVIDARNAVMSVVKELATLGVNPNTGELKDKALSTTPKSNKPVSDKLTVTKKITPTLAPTTAVVTPTTEASKE